MKALATLAASSTIAAAKSADAQTKPQQEKPKSEAPTTGYLSKSGLRYFDFEQGEGPTPKWGQFVNIQYVCYTISPDGESLIKHDSSMDRGKDGYLIHHGNGEHIWGMEEAIHSMRVGGRRRAIVPSSIAYILTDLGPIPPSNRKREQFSKALESGDGTVVLDIELRRIWDDPDDRGYYNDLTPTNEEILKILQSMDSNSG